VPEFVCRLGAPDGSVLEQRRVAVSEDALQRELEGEGFHVFNIAGARSRVRIPLVNRGERVKSQDFLVFNTQLRTLLRAGLPLAQSLELLAQQQRSPHFHALLDKIHQQVTTGVSLSDAFLSLGDTFPRLYANSLRAGERSGELESVIGRYVEYQTLMDEIRRKIITALTYPAVLVFLSICLVVLLVTFVIPKFSDFYLNFSGQLPLPTRIVLGASQGFQQNLLLIIGAAIVLGYGGRLWTTSSRGRRLADRVKLKLPVLGRVVHLLALSQFTRSLAVLLRGGIPMVPAVETASTSVKNVYVSELFLGCVREVQEGRALSEALTDTGQAPDMTLAMMKVGEATGALPEMLEHTSVFIDQEIDFLLNRIVTLFEPAVLLVMGLIVAGLLLSVYYPLLKLVTTIA
jgi:type IV pilus assembly protein PilC